LKNLLFSFKFLSINHKFSSGDRTFLPITLAQDSSSQRAFMPCGERLGPIKSSAAIFLHRCQLCENRWDHWGTQRTAGFVVFLRAYSLRPRQKIHHDTNFCYRKTIFFFLLLSLHC